MRIGIIGYGVIGSALGRWFKKHTSHDISIYDPHKHYKASMDDREVVFICTPAPTRKIGLQNLTYVEDAVNRSPKRAVIFMRSTVVPGTCDSLSTKEKRIHAMPEFLTERNADYDMEMIPLIVGENGSKINIKTLCHDIFPNKAVKTMSNTEAELTKYAHNAIAFTKILTCNGIYMLSKILGANYEVVKEAVTVSGLINTPHLSVPGPDGKLGIGGKCLSKDIYALASQMEKLGISEGKIFKSMYKHNEKYRIGEEFTE